MAHDVFISHSHEDGNAAKAVCAAMETAEIRCWLAPRDVIPGADWAQSIVEAVETAKVMVLIFSARSNSSEHVRREIGLAADAHIPIVPLRIDGTPLEGTMKYYLENTHWLDSMDPPTREHIALTVSTVARTLGREDQAAEVGTGDRGVGGTVTPMAARGLPDRGSRWRVVAIGLTAATLLVGVGVAGAILLGRNAASAPAAGTQRKSGGDTAVAGDRGAQTVTRTYAQVVDAYPANAPVVAFDATFDQIAVYGDNEGFYIPIHGEYKGVPIRGAFTVSRDGTYMGTPGVLWEMYGDTLMPGWPPGSPAWDWAKYEALVVPLAERDPDFSRLYYDTFNQMWGPRLTSNTVGRIGDLQVTPGDKLTFDSALRLVKVSAW